MTEQEYLDELIERYPCLAPMKEQIGHAYEILKEAYESGHKLLIAGRRQRGRFRAMSQGN